MQAERGRPTIACVILTVAFLLGVSSLVSASAHQETLAGDIHLTDDLLVGAGETLEIAPGSAVTGNGRLIVEGTLLVNGTPEAPVVMQARVVASPGGSLHVSHARFSDPVAGGIPSGAAAIEARGADAHILDTRFTQSHPALHWIGDAHNELDVARTSFSGVDGTAVHVGRAGAVRISDATFEDGLIAVVAEFTHASARFTVADSTFARNAAHLVLRFDSGEAKVATMEILRNDFGPLHADDDSNAGRGLHLVGLPTSGSTGASEARVLLAGNLFHGMPVAVHAMGQGFTLESYGDAWENNAVSLEVVDAHALVQGATFSGSTEYDVHTTGRNANVELVNAQYSEALLRVAEGNDLTANGKIIVAATTAAATAGTVAVGMMMFTETGRAFFARFLFLPLYTRLAPSDVLGHEKRKAILDYVAATPGTHMRRIGHALGMSYGTLTYHVYRLEKEGLVTSEDDGLFKRFYVSTGRVKERAQERPMVTQLRAVERQIYEDVVANPGSPQSAIAQRLGLSRQALHYHVKKLERAGIIRKEAQGRETLCYAAMELTGPPGAPSEVPEGDGPVQART